MPTAGEIIHSVKNWKQLSQRQARETFRAVFLADDQYVVKKFEIPLSVANYRRPWIQEHNALQKSPADSVPASFGYIETTDHEKRTAYLVKEFVPGMVCNYFEDDDIPEAAKLLAILHQHFIITDDANVHNFLKTETGRMLFIDMGRARVYSRCSFGFLVQIGRELAKFRREGLNWNSKQWAMFLPIYFCQFSYIRSDRIVIRISYRSSMVVRFIRKSLKERNPWK